MAFQKVAIDHSELNRIRRLNRGRMLQAARALDPIAFEHLVGAIFERMGYNVQATMASGDEGVDLLIRKRRKLAVVQCKRYKGTVSAPQVRDLYGTMIHNGASEAYMVTTGDITKPAREWSAGKSIHMIDGYALVEWISRVQTTDAEKRKVQFFGFLALLAVSVLLVVYLSMGGSQPRDILKTGVETWLANLRPQPIVVSPTPTSVPAIPTQPPAPTPIEPSSSDTTEALSVSNWVVPMRTDLGEAIVAFRAESQRYDVDSHGLTIYFPWAWQIEKAVGDGSGRSEVQTVRILSPMGDGIIIQIQPVSFAEDCNADELPGGPEDYMAIPVDPYILWRLRLDSPLVNQIAEHIFYASPTDAVPFPACSIEKNGGHFKFAYYSPRGSSIFANDTEILDTIDLILASLAWH